MYKIYLHTLDYIFIYIYGQGIWCNSRYSLCRFVRKYNERFATENNTEIISTFPDGEVGVLGFLCKEECFAGSGEKKRTIFV